MKSINKPRFLALFCAFLLIFSLLISYAQEVGTNISNSVLRLHILANSDHEQDQKLKLAVRDRILGETQGLFASSGSVAESRRLAAENIPLIKEIAEDEIKRHGFDYPVCVSIEETAFPTKAYGDIALPRGTYSAVRIKIGEAQGKNWWCVMYPPLCFTDEVILTSDEAKEKLKQSLSESEYSLISGKEYGAVPAEIRFKIVEIFQNLF